jgi:hypothetical protein
MLKNILKRDRRSNIEKLLDEQLECQLRDAESLEDISDVMALMEKRTELRKKGISPDTKAVIAGNLLGIALIMGYERGHVITTKALGFILRGRV